MSSNSPPFPRVERCRRRSSPGAVPACPSVETSDWPRAQRVGVRARLLDQCDHGAAFQPWYGRQQHLEHEPSASRRVPAGCGSSWRMRIWRPCHEHDERARAPSRAEAPALGRATAAAGRVPRPGQRKAGGTSHGEGVPTRAAPRSPVVAMPAHGGPRGGTRPRRRGESPRRWPKAQEGSGSWPMLDLVAQPSRAVRRHGPGRNAQGLRSPAPRPSRCQAGPWLTEVVAGRAASASPGLTPGTRSR